MEITLPKRKYSTGREVVNWVEVKGEYTLDNETTILIISNKMIEKISKKTGNKRKERRLEVTLKGFRESVEIGTESLKKLSFIKRLRKIAKTTIEKAIENIKTYELVIWKPIEKDFLGETLSESRQFMLNELEYCETPKDVNKWFKKYVKYFHPDFLGRELFPYEALEYELLIATKDSAWELLREMEDVFGYKL